MCEQVSTQIHAVLFKLSNGSMKEYHLCSITERRISSGARVVLPLWEGANAATATAVTNCTAVISATRTVTSSCISDCPGVDGTIN